MLCITAFGPILFYPRSFFSFSFTSLLVYIFMHRSLCFRRCSGVYNSYSVFCFVFPLASFSVEQQSQHRERRRWWWNLAVWRFRQQPLQAWTTSGSRRPASLCWVPLTGWAAWTQRPLLPPSSVLTPLKVSRLISLWTCVCFPCVGVFCEGVNVPPMLVYCVNMFVSPCVGVLCEHVCVPLCWCIVWTCLCPPVLVYCVNMFVSPCVGVLCEWVCSPPPPPPPMLVYCVNVFVFPHVGVLCECVHVPPCWCIVWMCLRLPMLVYCVHVFMCPHVGVLCECVRVPSCWCIVWMCSWTPILVCCVNMCPPPPPMLVYSVNVFASPPPPPPPPVGQHLKPLFRTSTFPPQPPYPFFLYPSFPFSLLHSSFCLLFHPLPSNCFCAVCFVVSSKKSSLEFDPWLVFCLFVSVFIFYLFGGWWYHLYVSRHNINPSIVVCVCLLLDIFLLIHTGQIKCYQKFDFSWVVQLIWFDVTLRLAQYMTVNNSKQDQKKKHTRMLTHTKK